MFAHKEWLCGESSFPCDMLPTIARLQPFGNSRERDAVNWELVLATRKPGEVAKRTLHYSCWFIYWQHETSLNSIFFAYPYWMWGWKINDVEAPLCLSIVLSSTSRDPCGVFLSLGLNAWDAAFDGSLKGKLRVSAGGTGQVAQGTTYFALFEKTIGS